MSKFTVSDYNQIMRELQRKAPKFGSGNVGGMPKKRVVSRSRSVSRSVGSGNVGGTVIGGKRKKNPWVQFVKKYAKANGISYAQAMIEASQFY